MTSSDNQFWLRTWYGQGRANYLLFPLMWLFCFLSSLRRYWLCRFAQKRVPVPVIVVGNITLGGTGKTPLLLALLAHCQARGFRPGVVSRGYGGQAPSYPFRVTTKAIAAQVGDEPLLIFQQSGCPVVVGPDRLACAQQLVAEGCNLILSDDGLQHYRLGRDLEILVVDGARGFGNGYCLPVGPLREPLSRIAKVDMLVVNGDAKVPLPLPEEIPVHTMHMRPRHWWRLIDGMQLALSHFPPGTRVHGVAGIGNPRRFYQTLEDLHLQVVEHDFPDHHTYDAGDLIFAEPFPLVMTAKDAVKCHMFARDSWYALVVDAQVSTDFWLALDIHLDKLVSQFPATRQDLS